MKVNNKSIFVGDDSLRVRHEGTGGAKQAGKSRSVNGSAVREKLDPIAAKRKDAQKKAMKIVGDAFAGDKKIDDDLNERRARIKSLQKDLGTANKAIREMEDERAALRKAYGVDENSQEEKDLKLLEKEIRAKMPGSDVRLTKDEMDALKEIKGKELTEYQQRSLDILKSEEPYVRDAYEAGKEIETENRIISGTKLERLKTHTMVDAKEQAENVMDAASREIVGMLVNEAKEHVDEEAEKREEQAKAEKEKQKELEERIESAKEKKKEQEELTAEIVEGSMDILSNKADADAVQQELKDMMNKMKLIEDDIKGAEVDKKV